MTQHWVNPVNATSDAWGYELSPRELMRKIKPNVSHNWHAPTERALSRQMQHGCPDQGIYRCRLVLGVLR
jgi:hypothetical protein